MARNLTRLQRVKTNRMLSLRAHKTMYNEVMIAVSDLVDRDMMARAVRTSHYISGAALLALCFYNAYSHPLTRLQSPDICYLKIKSYVPKSHWFNTEPILGRRGVRRLTIVEEDSDI